MIAAAPTPTPVADLATAVRMGQWAEVRRQTEAMPPPLPPAAALVAARAARVLGRPQEALTLLRHALPRAGQITPALDLEAAEVSVALGHDPWRYLRPLLVRPASATQRNAAETVVREAAEALRVDLARAWLRRPLRHSMWRVVAGIVAERSGKERTALALLERRDDDAAATRAARWLASRTDLSVTARLTVAGALLTGGRWREADRLLSTTAVPAQGPDRFRACYLRGRAAYRLGELGDAAAWFERASQASQRPSDSFSAAVQRARVAEIRGDPSAALGLWDAARAAQPREVEGWDGGARDRVVLGHVDDAVALLRRAPPAVLRVAGPRLAAQLLLRGQDKAARGLLAVLPSSLAAARALRVALELREGRLDRARALAAGVLGDPSCGPWREVVAALLPRPTKHDAAAPPTRDPETLASEAAAGGIADARNALARALAADPAWARLLAGGVPAQPEWSGPAHDLAAVGLEGDAATLFPDTFPTGTPEELAWSARTLAAWGNAPASLAAGEQLWRQLGVAASLVPSTILEVVLPPPLVTPCRDAALAEGVRPDWLAGVVRVESRFDSKARSNAGAIGLGQIMPELARQHGVAEAELWDPDRAYRLAARELARLERRFGPRLEVVAAAYNAGESAVASWLAAAGEVAPSPTGTAPATPATAPTVDPIWRATVFTAAIPYGETASYVLAVEQGVALARALETAPATSPAPTPGRPGTSGEPYSR
jgi:soluble lytic murein transglycosylase-like protein